MMKYVRSVEFQVKSDKTHEFTRVFNNDVLPVLKQQPGFKHELAMVNGSRAIGISVWSDKASADIYQAKIYPELLKKLLPLVEAAPRIEAFDLTASTLAV